MDNRHSGLTALELLITLSIVILLIITGFPGLREYRMNQQLKSAASLLSANLKLARNEAISLNSHTIICPAARDACTGQTDWQVGWLIFADLNGDQQWQEQEPVLRRVDGLGGIAAQSRSRTRVRFLPGGAAPGSNSSIILCDQRGLEKGIKVVISNSGRIRNSGLSDSDAGQCDPGRA